MEQAELREAILSWIRQHYEGRGRIPSVRDVRRRFGLSTRKLYSLFPDGLRQICREAGLPAELIKEREMLTAKATEARRQGIISTVVKPMYAEAETPDQAWYQDLIPDEEKRVTMIPPEVQFCREFAIELEKILQWLPLSDKLRLYICRAVFVDWLLASNPQLLQSFIMNLAPYLNPFHLGHALSTAYRKMVEERNYDPKMWPFLMPFAPPEQIPPPYYYYHYYLPPVAYYPPYYPPRVIYIGDLSEYVEEGASEAERTEETADSQT